LSGNPHLANQKAPAVTHVRVKRQVLDFVVDQPEATYHHQDLPFYLYEESQSQAAYLWAK
jgi:hypothetical protein